MRSSEATPIPAAIRLPAETPVPAARLSTVETMALAPLFSILRAQPYHSEDRDCHTEGLQIKASQDSPPLKEKFAQRNFFLPTKAHRLGPIRTLAIHGLGPANV
jgi:hypothetical protein